MEPRIQYTTTSDGVRIAYCTYGQGPFLVMPPPALPFSHIAMEFEIDEWRHWYDHLARQATIVRYDGRGAGQSDRTADDVYSLDANVRDLDAVVRAIGAERVHLMGLFYSGMIAMKYAMDHPERVDSLMLWCALSEATQNQQTPAMSEALKQLIESDFPTFTETISHTAFGWSAGDPAHKVALMMQAACTPDVVRDSWEHHNRWNVTPELPRIQCPTLVMHRRQYPLIDPAVAKLIGSAVPHARVAMVEGASLAPFIGDMEEPLRLMYEAIGGDPSMAAEAAHVHAIAAGGFRAIMFTDIEGSTAATQRLGDAEAHAMLRAHNDIVREALHTFGGDEVKHTGDGIMASFTSVTLALECAIQIQRGVAMHSDTTHVPFNVRIGINAGEPVVEGGDLFGTAVQMASRVCNRAEPQQILVTDVIRQLVAGKGFLFGDRGESELRGFEDPVRLYEVRWRNEMG